MEKLTRVNRSHSATPGLSAYDWYSQGKIPVTSSLKAGVGNFSQKILWPTCSSASHSVLARVNGSPQGLGWRGKPLAEPIRAKQ